MALPRYIYLRLVCLCIKYIVICILNNNYQRKLSWYKEVYNGFLVWVILLTISIREKVILLVWYIKLSKWPNIFGHYFNFFPLLDLPTVEELMKTIKIDSFGISGLDLQPVRYVFFSLDCASYLMVYCFVSGKLWNHLFYIIIPSEWLKCNLYVSTYEPLLSSFYSVY